MVQNRTPIVRSAASINRRKATTSIKGALFPNTPAVVNDDKKWWAIMRGVYDTFTPQHHDGRHREVFQRQDRTESHSGLRSALRYTALPALELQFDGNGSVSHRWKVDVAGFAMPVKGHGGQLADDRTDDRVEVDEDVADEGHIEVATDLFYVTVASSRPCRPTSGRLTAFVGAVGLIRTSVHRLRLPSGRSKRYLLMLLLVPPMLIYGNPGGVRSICRSHRLAEQRAHAGLPVRTFARGKPRRGDRGRVSRDEVWQIAGMAVAGRPRLTVPDGLPPLSTDESNVVDAIRRAYAQERVKVTALFRFGWSSPTTPSPVGISGLCVRGRSQLRRPRGDWP
jgi:hypothetical protein